MHLSLSVTTMLAAGGLLLVAAAPGPRSADSAFRDREVARIQRHLSGALARLLERDVARLTPAQRAARARSIQRLRDYRRAGEFPRNTDFPGRRIPYFIDRTGIRCAMAYLIEQSGHGDFVARVARTQNNAYIAELAGDPELRAWLEENGLTEAEAARIQPAYNPPPSDEPSVTRGGAMAAAWLGVGSIALTVSSSHLGLSRTVSGVVGMAAGMVGILAGASNLDERGDLRSWGMADVGIGTVAAVLGGRLLFGPPTATRTGLVATPGLGRQSRIGVRIAF